MAKDRNFDVRQKMQHEFEARRAMQQLADQRSAFVLDFAAGKVKAYDRNQQPITAGDIVLYAPPPGFIYWKVESVEPNRHPRVQPGVLTVTLSSVIPLNFQGNGIGTEILVIGRQPTDKPGDLPQPEPRPAEPYVPQPPVDDTPLVELPMTETAPIGGPADPDPPLSSDTDDHG